MADKRNWVVVLPVKGEAVTKIGPEQHFMLLQQIAPDLKPEINLWAANVPAPRNDRYVVARGFVNPFGRICFDECSHQGSLRNQVYDAVFSTLNGAKVAKKDDDEFVPTPYTDPVKILNLFAARAMNEHIPNEDDLLAISRYGMGISSVDREEKLKYLNMIMEAENPAAAIRLAQETKCLRFLLPDVADAKGFWQRYKKTSSELFEHLLHTLDYVAKHSDDRDLRWAALLHDIGKIESVWVDEDGRTHFRKGPEGQGANHEEVGPEMIKRMFDNLAVPEEMTNRVCFFVREHMFDHFDNKKGAKKFLEQMGGPEQAHAMLTLRGGDVQGKPGQAEAEEEIVEMRKLIDKVLKKDDNEWEVVPEDSDFFVVLVDHDII
jgi:hypothetical protein